VVVLNQISDRLQAGDHGAVAELTARAVAEGTPAGEILDDGLIAGMNVVGRRFGDHEIFLPQVLLAARAMNAGIEVLRPLLVEGEVRSLGKVVLGTMKGDLHDIGKNLVGIMLKGAGFEVTDLGSDVPVETFVDTAVAEGATVIGLSALLTTTMTGMRDVAAELRARGLADRIKLVIGGAPVTKEFAADIGADGYGYDAAHAVEVVKRLTGVA
jgi:5-methyltetrahydrofolate--homocysteine methyltransferase